MRDIKDREYLYKMIIRFEPLGCAFIDDLSTSHAVNSSTMATRRMRCRWRNILAWRATCRHRARNYFAGLVLRRSMWKRTVRCKWLPSLEESLDIAERAELEEMSSAPAQPTTCLDLEADALATVLSFVGEKAFVTPLSAGKNSRAGNVRDDLPHGA